MTPQRRIKIYSTKSSSQWKSIPEFDDSRTRFRVVFNDKALDADPVCMELRGASSDLNAWIARVRR